MKSNCKNYHILVIPSGVRNLIKKFIFLLNVILLFLIVSCDKNQNKKIEICFEDVKVKLGDSFQEVDKIYDLTPDPNNFDGLELGNNCFYSPLNHNFKYKNGKLNSIEYLEFDKDMKLVAYQISYTLDIEKKYLNEVFDFLEGRVGNCISSENKTKIFSEAEIDVLSGTFPKYNFIFRLKSNK